MEHSFLFGQVVINGLVMESVGPMGVGCYYLRYPSRALTDLVCPKTSGWGFFLLPKVGMDEKKFVMS